MKTKLFMIIFVLALIVACSTSRLSTFDMSSNSYNWILNINIETNQQGIPIPKEKQNLIKKMIGIWRLELTANAGDRREFLCFYDMVNDKFHFITIRDPSIGWNPGELRYRLSHRTGEIFLGNAYSHTQNQLPENRSLSCNDIEATLDNDKLIIRYTRISDNTFTNIDNTYLIVGSIQILKRIDLENYKN